MKAVGRLPLLLRGLSDSALNGDDHNGEETIPTGRNSRQDAPHNQHDALPQRNQHPKSAKGSSPWPTGLPRARPLASSTATCRSSANSSVRVPDARCAASRFAGSPPCSVDLPPALPGIRPPQFNVNGLTSSCCARMKMSYDLLSKGWKCSNRVPIHGASRFNQTPVMLCPPPSGSP